MLTSENAASVPLTFRPDLNGRCVRIPNGSTSWLVFNGERHEIVSSGVAEGLFVDGHSPIEIADADAIVLGSELGPGSSLAKADGAHAIYLVACALNGTAERHLIRDMDQFYRFGFDPARIQHGATNSLEHLTLGVDLEGVGGNPSVARRAAPPAGVDPAVVAQWREEFGRLTNPAFGEALPAIPAVDPTIEDLQRALYHLRSRYHRAVTYADRLREALQIERRRLEEAQGIAETLKADLQDANVAIVYWRNQVEH